MIKLNSAQLDGYNLKNENNLWTYCAFDCVVTRQIWEVQRLLLEPETTGKTYEFELGLQAPVLAMMQKGFRINPEEIRLSLEGNPEAKFDLEEVGIDKKYESTEEAKREIRNRKRGLKGRSLALGGMLKDDKRKVNKWQIVNLDSMLQRLALAISGETINYHSPKQLQKLLYVALRLPEVTKRVKGKIKISTDHEALEHLALNYPRAKLFASIILELRTIEKLIEVLEKNIDEDDRMRCSFNIAGTTTGRFSSSESVWETGMCLQNVTPELRRIFIPDEGKVLLNADLEQAESRAVAYLSQDKKYIEACETADLHTTVAAMLFGVKAEDVHKIYYRHFTYRDMSKRAGHALNYGLSPHSLARNMHITVKQAWRVYLLYLGGEMRTEQAAKLDLYSLPHEKDGRYLQFPAAFPGIKKWHASTQEELETTGYLTTPLGRKRTFWGRLTDAATLREAIAFRPQSLIADILNTGMKRLWDEEKEWIDILIQVHDSVVAQTDEKNLDAAAQIMVEYLEIPVKIFGRTLLVPAEVKVGQNWRDMKKYENTNNI